VPFIDTKSPVQPYITLIFPAYNEAKGIANTVGEAVEYFRLRGLSYEIIVAADGNDGTREIVAELSQKDSAIKVIGSAHRGGKGLGIRNAVAMAKGRFIGFADADNKTPITEFEKFEPHLVSGVDMVIGSRAMARTVIERPQPWYRRVGSRVFAFGMHSLVGLRGIADTQCGFKFFQPEVAHFLFSRQRIDGYLFDVEILCLALRADLRIEQIPVRWRDDNDSRLNVVSGGLKVLRELLTIRWMLFSGVYERSKNFSSSGHLSAKSSSLPAEARSRST
jgi:dolichyl-phosphate beta-glucosyltransferase